MRQNTSTTGDDQQRSYAQRRDRFMLEKENEDVGKRIWEMLMTDPEIQGVE